MLDIHLLGTGGMVPLPDRFLTSLYVQYKDEVMLIDCGEGTQVAIRAMGLGFKRIGVICLTHFHADHLAGLPGLLLTIGNSGRAEPLLIAGPRHVGEVVDCLRVIAPQLPYAVEYLEIPQQGGELLRLEALTLSAHPVPHHIPCYAFRFDLARQGRFDADKARALGIPVQQWSVLQRGECVEADGRTFRPDEVLGPPRKGLRLCYATDLRPTGALSEFARDADLFICEGMYGDPAMLDKAREHKHCLFSEAAEMARAAGARALWLTHFSPSMPDPAEFLPQAAEIFPNTRLERETVLRFSE